MEHNVKLLRRTIRKLIFESEMTAEEKSAEFKKWYKREESKACVQELTKIFEDAYSFKAGPWGNKFDVYEMNYKPEPNCIVRIRAYQMHGAVKLDEIETTPECEGKGYAKQAIKMIQDAAKKHGVKIYLEAKAFNTHKGEGRMSSDGLEGWYASQGFKKNGWKMEWKP